MSRNLMPKSGAMAPYVVVNRDAAVAGVFSVDGEKGAINLTTKYVQVTAYNQKIGSLEASIETINGNIITINESIGSLTDAVSALTTTTTNLNNNKAAKGANNDITELNGLTKAITIAQGGTGAKDVNGARTAFSIDRFVQSTAGTYMYSPDKSVAFTVLDNGTWGLYKAGTNDRVALPLAAGGTGALTAADARKNLNVMELGEYGWGGMPTGIPRIASLKDMKGSGIYTLFGKGTSSPTIGVPEDTGNEIITCICTPVYSNTWMLNAWGGSGNSWTGRYDPTAATPAPIWFSRLKQGSYGIGASSGAVEITSAATADSLTLENGLYVGNGDHFGKPGGVGNGQYIGLLTMNCTNGNNYKFQLAGSYSGSGRMFYRSMSGGTYRGWLEVPAINKANTWVARQTFSDGGEIYCDNAGVWFAESRVSTGKYQFKAGTYGNNTDYARWELFGTAGNGLRRNAITVDINNATVNNTDSTTVTLAGRLQTDSFISSNGYIETKSHIGSRGGNWPSLRLFPANYSTTNPGSMVMFEAGGAGDSAVVGVTVIRRRADGNQTGQVAVSFPTTSGALALQGTSGRDFKRDIKKADPSEALERIMSLEMVNFVYKDDNQSRQRFGVIAEDAEKIAPQYIKHNQEEYESEYDPVTGEKLSAKFRDRPSVDNNPIVMDLLGAIQAQQKQIEELKTIISEMQNTK